MDDAACQICFDDSYDIRGLIDSCSHRFCYPCISKWSGIENKCPLCRNRFHTITQRLRVENPIKDGNQGGPSPLGRVVGVEDVEQRDQRVHFEDPSFQQWIDSLVCMACGGEENEECLLICDECQSVACHTYCANLTAVPEGEWLCTSCSDRRNRPRRRRAITSRTRPLRTSSALEESSSRPRTRLRRVREAVAAEESPNLVPRDLEDDVKVEDAIDDRSETTWESDSDRDNDSAKKNGSETSIDYAEDSPVQRRRPQRNVSQRPGRMVRNPGQWQQVRRDREHISHITRNWEALRTDSITFEQVLPQRTSSRQRSRGQGHPSSRRSRPQTRTTNLQPQDSRGQTRARPQIQSRLPTGFRETIVDLTQSNTPDSIARQRTGTAGTGPRRHSSPQPLRSLAAKLRVDLEVEARGSPSTTPAHHRPPQPSSNVNGSATVVPPTAERTFGSPRSPNGLGSARRLRTKADFNFASTTVARLSMAPHQQEVISPQPLAQRLAQRGGGVYSNAIHQLYQGEHNLRSGSPPCGHEGGVSADHQSIPNTQTQRTRKGKEVASEFGELYADKDRALTLVTPHLRLLLDEGVMTKDQYKQVARAATHAMMELPLFRASKPFGTFEQRGGNENASGWFNNNRMQGVQGGNMSQRAIELEQAAADIVDKMFLETIRNT